MKLNLIQHFDERADSYDRAEWVHDPQLMCLLLDFMGLATGRRVLDIGAGTGAVLAAALETCPGLGECVALDLSHEMLARISHPRIRKLCQDGESLPFPDGSFDVVVCRQSLHYIDDLDACLGEVHRVLTASGQLVIAQTTPFEDEDEAWWKKIVRTRQPLRRHDLTLHDLQDLLARTGFVPARILQTRATESLNAWLARYERSAEQTAEVRRLHLEAPEAYRRIHGFQPVNDDLLVDHCWTFIEAGKRSVASACDGCKSSD